MRDVLNVHVAYDAEASVWYVSHSDVHGLRVEAPDMERMIERVSGALRDLLDDRDGPDGLDIPVEVIAHHAMSVRRAVA